MLTLTYEYKLAPTKQQAEEMVHILDVCRSVWNYALRERKDWIASRKSPINACSLRGEYIMSADAPYPGFKEQCQSLTQAKKSNPRLKSVNAQVLQQVLRKLDKAFRDMKDRKFGFPRFKKRGRMRSFVFPQLGKNPLGQGAVKLPNIGLVKFRQSRPYPEGFQVKQARIVKRASGFYLMLCFQSELDLPEVPLTGHFVGVDVGLEYFLSTSDGLQLERPKFFVDMQRKLKLLQRRLKRKNKGSANWLKAQSKIALLHERIANTRKDFHFKVAHQLCDSGDVIAVEDLNLIGLSRGMLGKHMLDAGHGQFLNQILPWVCFKRGKGYVKVKAAGTSQECPDCGAPVTKTLKDRWHHCPECGSSKPRDIASGEVIRNRAVGHTVQQNACGDGLAGAAHAA
jgi:putative transposase